MNDIQFWIIFIFIMQIVIAVMLEIVLFPICDDIKEIKKLLEKYINQESQKG